MASCSQILPLGLGWWNTAKVEHCIDNVFCLICSLEADRDRSRARKKPRPSPEINERDRRKDKQETKTSSFKEEDTEEKAEDEEKTDGIKDSGSPGIKVKTLEEILREKALKKLEERRAHNKETKDEEESKEENVDVDEDDNDVEKAEEEGPSVDDTEDSTKSPLKKDTSTKSKESSVDSSSKKVISPRKVSLTNIGRSGNSDGSGEEIVKKKVSSSDGQNWPLKKVISTVNRNCNKDRALDENAGALETVVQNEKVDEKEGTSKEPPSPFQQVRVKSFEEIMALKRKRREEKEESKDSSENVDEESTSNASELGGNSTVLALSSPKRLKRIVRKPSGDGDTESKAVSSSNTESVARGFQRTGKRTVFVMEKPSVSEQSTDNGN